MTDGASGPQRGPADLPPVRFDPAIDVSPYELFRRFREGRPPALYHLRGRERARLTLRGARPVTEERVRAGWTPPEAESVWIDEDGVRSRAVVRDLRRRGAPGVRALFGGLRLYDYALDPRVVGEERYLRPASTESSGK